MDYIYDVNGIDKTSQELDYDDIVFLCNEYIQKNNTFPSNKDFRYSNNLPSLGKLVRVLRKRGISKADFVNLFGHNYHYTCKGAEVSYSYYIDEYKRLSFELKRPIGEKELKKYSLPRGDWFVKHCPDKTIQSWNDFVAWCGFLPLKKRSKEDIAKILLDYDSKIDRPILRRDITMDNLGFSISQIRNIWGSLANCKKELGLKITPQGRVVKSFEYYQDALDSIIDKIIKDGKTEIVWRDILSSGIPCSYSALNKAFENEHVSLSEYISERGVTFWRTSAEKFASHVFDTGEKARSSYEYDFTIFLNSIGLLFDRDYERDVLYSRFITQNVYSKINCDYLFYDCFCVEILGFQTVNPKSNREILYANKISHKESLLKENGIPYLFLCPDDFNDNSYKSKFLLFLIGNLHKYKFQKNGLY